MSIKAERLAVIKATIASIKPVLDKEMTVESIEQAKHQLMQLAKQKHLFPRTEFPVPDAEQIERTILIYEEDDGSYALYVNTSRPGQTSPPHDHGGSWAIVVAVEGEETHRVYKAPGITKMPSDNDVVEQIGQIIVKPGTAISLLPDGIHSIHAESTQPLLHLHLYGLGFPFQGQRCEYDLVNNQVNQFVMQDLSFIEDGR